MRKRIGYKHYDMSTEESNEQTLPAQTEGSLITVSPAHADLLETIGSLAEIISSPTFSNTYTDEQRNSFIMRYSYSVALSAELMAYKNTTVM
jgi:hypothetical protein